MNRRKKKGHDYYQYYMKGQNIFDVLNSTVNEMFKLLDGISQDNKGSKNIISNLDNYVVYFLTSFKSIGPKKLLEMESSILQGTPNIDNANNAMNILLNFFNCLKYIHEKLKNTHWMIQSSKAILEIALEFKHDKVSFIPYYSKILDYFLLLISLWQSTRIYKLYEIIKIQKEILESLTSPIPISAAQRLLHNDILKLRNLNDKQIMKLLLDIYAIFFKSGQNVTVHLMTNTFIEEIKELIENMKNENMRQKDIIIQNIVFDILVLQEVQPSQTEQFNDIINMMNTVFHPSNTNILIDYPLLQLAFIRMFSNLMSKKKASIYEISTNEIILKLINLKTVSFHFKKTLLDMIMDSIQYSSNENRLNTNFLTGILEYTGDSLFEVRHKVSLIISKIVQNVSLTPYQFELIGNIAFQRIHDKSFKIQKEYQDILGLLSPAIHIGINDSWKFRLLTSIQSVTNLNKSELQQFMNMLSRNPTDSINRQNLFDFVSSHVLKDIGLSFASKNFKEDNIIKYDKFIKKNLNILDSIPLFLLVIECAQYIVNNKLRVPPKNPNETLSWIESIFTDISSSYGKCLKHSNELNENFNGDIDSILSEQSSSNMPSIQVSSNLSLNFIDILEKVIYNASYGCLTIPNLTNLSNQSFFVSNRKTCNDWLISIRPKVLIASSIANSHYDTIRHGMERLHYLGKMFESQSQLKTDLKSLKKELEGCLLIVASSLMNIRESDTLEGLKIWADSLCNKAPSEKINTKILTPLIYESKGWYEKTIKEYESMLVDDHSKESVSKQFLIDKISSCLVNLCDWEESEKWLSRYSSSNNLSPYNFLKALVSFNKENYEDSISSLSKIINNVQIDWIDPTVNILMSDALTLQAMSKYKIGDTVPLQKYLDKAKSLVNTTLFRESLSPTEISRLIAQLHTIRILECEFNNEEKPRSMVHNDIVLNRGVQDIGIWNKVLRVHKFCNCNENILPQILKLSRKQYNVNYASGLIERWAINSPLTVYEKSKIYYIKNEKVKGIELLWNAYNEMSDKEVIHGEMSNIHIRMALKLARWMKKSKKELINSDFPLNEAQINSTIESILQNITMKCEQNAKGWFRFADWNYKKGVNITNKFLSNPFKWIPQNIKEELNILLEGKDVNQEKFYEDLFKGVIEGVDEKSPQDSTKENEIKKIICSHIKEISDLDIDRIINVFIEVRKYLLLPFKESMNAYFKFMCLNSSSSDQTVASLRLLRFIVKYGKDFENEIFEGISNSPGIAWINIVPQLLARLGHPNETVRSQVLNLLKKIGKESAHVMVYPAIVGAMTESSTIDGQFDQQKLYEDLKHSLIEHSPDLVREVDEVLNQFLKITVLWEEKAYYSFKDLQSNIINSARTYEEETSRIKENEITDIEKRKLLFDRYVTIMKPALLKLERFLNIISRKPETRNEQLFVQMYLPRINSLHELLKNPLAENDIDVNKVLKLVKGLVSDFSKKKRNIIKLSEISPTLHNMKSTNIPMPGLIKKDENITIQSFENIVEILPTKTKPKRIILVGSDGRKYSYLLKGHEDLHLDERVMQFLSYVNLLLHKDSETKDRKMSSRNYAVIPIGTNSGLIQWVDGTIPLYNLYTEWYRKTIETTHQNQDNVKKAMRPIDMFYSKIIPLVDELGIKNVTSRNEWPIDILKKVFKSLQEETPNNLLQKELWCSSSTTQQWWNKVKKYTTSTAVMSIVGYIIGLGDRHLDNILLDFETGEVVHIDYNICFERGLKLRVPEVVPFRLTQNMKQALGIAGVEGKFRIACEHALRVLRGSKETLLTLLEAFVYDPLVDWTSDKNIIEEKALELKIILSLFIDRFESLKQTSSRYTVSLTTDLPILLKYSNVIINGKKQYDDLVALMKERQSKKSNLDSKINEINNRLKSLEKDYSMKEKSMKNEQKNLDELKTKLEIEYEKCMNEYNETLDGYSNFISSEDIDSVFNNTTVDSNLRTLQLIERYTYLDIQEKVVRKCKDKEKEMTQLLTQRDAVLVKTIEHLKTYINFVSQLPGTYMNNTLFSKWMSLLKEILSENCKDIYNILSKFEDEEKSEIQKTQAKEKELSNRIAKYAEIISELNMKRSMVENERAAVEKQVQELRKKLIILLTKENDLSTNSGSYYMQNCSLYCLSDISDQLYTLITLIQSSLTIDFDTEINNLIDRSLFLSQLISDAWFNVEKDKISQYLQPYQMIKKHYVKFKELKGSIKEILRNIDKSKISPMSVSTMLANIQKLKTSYESMKGIGGYSNENKLANDVMKWNDVINRIKTYSSSNNLSIAIDILNVSSIVEQQHIETALSITNQSQLIITFKFIELNLHILFDVLQSISDNQTFTDDVIDVILNRYSTMYYESLFIPMFGDCISQYTMKISKTNFTLNKSFISSKILLPWLKKECSNDNTRENFISTIKSLVECQENLKIKSLERSNIISELTENEKHYQISQIELVGFQWMHEHKLILSEDSNTPVVKQKLVADIENSIIALQNLDQAVRKCDEDYSQLESSILKQFNQFIKNNPQYDNEHNEFKTICEQRKEIYNQIHNKIRDIIKIGKDVESFEEAYMMYLENLPLKKNIESFISMRKNIDSLEVQLNELEDKKSKHKLLKESKLAKLNQLKLDIDLDQSLLKKMKDEYSHSRDYIKDPLIKISEFVESQLSNETDSLISSIIQNTEKWDYVRDIQSLAKKLSKNQKKFKSLLQKLSSLITFVNKKISLSHEKDDTSKSLNDFSDIDISSLNEIIELQSTIESQIMKLLNLSNEWIQQHEEVHESDDEEDKLIISDEVQSTLATSKIVQRVQHQQLKNATAVNILKRIKQKLEGSDNSFMTCISSSTNEEKISVSEQVDRLIKAATDEDNLCRLYEGWSAWI